MAQKETLSSLTHGNFAKELSISAGKMPPNAVEFEKLVIGTFLIDKKGLDYSIDLILSMASFTKEFAVSKPFLMVPLVISKNDCSALSSNSKTSVDSL
jgi:hypothetical protein